MEIKKVSEVLVWDGYRKIIKKYFQMPDGNTADFEIFKHGHVVCVLALTTDKQVVIAKQFRPGPEKTLLELPGGGCEPSEEPLAAVKRELIEETGYTGDFQYVSSSLDSAYSTLLRHHFVAMNCQKIQEQKLDPREFIEVILMPLAEFRAHLRGGQLTDVATGFIGLDFLKL